MLIKNVNYIGCLRGLLRKSVDKKNREIEFVAQGTERRYLFKVTYLYDDLKTVEVKMKKGKWGLIGFLSYGKFTRTTKRWRELLKSDDRRVLAFEYLWKLNYLPHDGLVRAYFPRKCEECGRSLYKEESIQNHAGLVCKAKKAERAAVQRAVKDQEREELANAPVF